MTPMTIAEAIEKLKTYPPNWLFLTDGYEMGYDVPRFGEERVIPRTRNISHYNGEYVNASGGRRALIIKRNEHT